MKLSWFDYEQLGYHPQNYGEEKIFINLVKNNGFVEARKILDVIRKERQKEHKKNKGA